jgi:hypothetical protein
MATPAEIAAGMLKRYSTPKVALEMAQLHAHDSARREHWDAVAREIMRQADLHVDGSPRRTRRSGDAPRSRDNWAALFTKHNLPPAPGKVLNVRWVAGRDDWYVQTSRGWYWLRPEKRVWIYLPNGPMT